MLRRVHRVRMNILVAQRLRDGFGGDHAFVAGLVRQPRARAVTSPIAQTPGDVGAAIAVDLDDARVRL